MALNRPLRKIHVIAVFINELRLLAHFLILPSRCAGNLSSSSSGEDRPRSGAFSSFREIRHTEYESRFEGEYVYSLPVVKDVVEKCLDCGNPKCGFARICCPRYRVLDIDYYFPPAMPCGWKSEASERGKGFSLERSCALRWKLKSLSRADEGNIIA